MDRYLRISEEIKKELSDIISNELKDPRIPLLTSVTSVKVTKDLKIASCYISVLGGDKERENVIIALDSAAKYIRRQIGNRMKLRNTPEFKFHIDRSIERGIYMSSLIDKTIKEDEERRKDMDEQES